MRRLLPLAVLAALLGLAPSAGAGTLFVLKGRGWGHGVGMSQWGAFGMAQDGSSYRQILGHYYTDTTVERRSNPRVGVELASGRTSLEVGSRATFRVVAGEKSRTHGAGNATVTKTRWGRIKVEGIRGSFASPATFRAGTAPIRMGGTEYRGTLVVSVKGGRLRVVNRLRMESYIRGVVPRESPAWWPAAALEAQAVAARSYALYALHGGGKCGGAFCPDTRDQVYGGLSGEEPSTNAAVAATAREVVVDGADNVAQTFFHSSSGGRTANSEDVWSSTVSYLRSVRDGRDLVRANPNRRWTVLRTPRQFRSGLGLPCTPSGAALIRDPSNRVGGIRTCGITVDGGDSLRWELELKSNRFWLGTLRLKASDRLIEWRQRRTLSGRAQDVRNSSLRFRRAGGSWRTWRSVTGRFSVRIRPRITTTYRLGPRAFGKSVRVRVQPRLRITAVRARSLAGTMRPRRAGTTVSVQKLVKGSTWTTVRTASVNAEGAWRAGFRVDPGRYRAFASPGHGLVAGASPVIRVGA
ncbi:MAG: SpoIID/LytB domain-containing protein [Gaiellaceae bacterium]